MERSELLELKEKLEAKGVTWEQAAENIKFDVRLLNPLPGFPPGADQRDQPPEEDAGLIPEPPAIPLWPSARKRKSNWKTKRSGGSA